MPSVSGACGVGPRLPAGVARQRELFACIEHKVFREVYSALDWSSVTTDVKMLVLVASIFLSWFIFVCKRILLFVCLL